MTSLAPPVSTAVTAVETDQPRVTAIMPTRDRRAFVTQALRQFARQDYPNLELIVVDDGRDPVADLIPATDGRIRYLRLDRTHSVGAKRNLACRHATGEIIAHWDDDDWSAPTRIRRQVAELLECRADLCGLAGVRHYRPMRGDAWVAAPGVEPIAGSSLVYRREAWEVTGFPDVNLGDDRAFVDAIPASRRCTLPGADLMVVVDHGRNLSGRLLAEPRWRPAPMGEVAVLLDTDCEFYSALRGAAPPAAPPGSQVGVTVAAAFEVFSGYGSTAEYLALSLARAGARVRAVPLGMNHDGISDELLSMIGRRSLRDHQPTVYHSWLRGDIAQFHDVPDLFISTMWEADRFPPAWVPELQRATAVIVPSTFVANACRASGVTRPVVVVPQGADPDVYGYQRRPQRDGLATLIVAPVDGRKHTLLAIDAWKAAFAGDQDARLVIKTTYGYHNYLPDDPRISYVDRVEPTRGILGYYRDADILMALGSEGFGLPLVEGMATGLPVVALDAEGQRDVCSAAGELVLSVPPAGREPHASEVVGSAGRRSIPDFDTVVNRLRWVDHHRDEARDLGRRASDWAIENRNIWSLGPAVLDVIQSRSSRRRCAIAPRTMWIPTLGAACGIGESVARLHRNLPSVRMCTDEPPIRTSGLVHVQHEPSIVDDRRLERFMVRAKESHVPIVVTEHSVFDHPATWEHLAGALVTTTSAGAAWLRRRHPRIRVELIPLGCECWSPTVKQARGLTIGFFGFPGSHKGLDLLAGAARRIPGCDVVLYAHHTGSIPATLADWPSEVPLRWERGWYPMPEIAARLAAETDVLAFPYREVPHRSASSAATLGLSTGVPVLTSDTTWFADLGDAVVRAGADVDAVTDALTRLLHDDDLRERTTAAARAYCSENSWSRIAARHVDLWNSIEFA